MNHPVDMHPEDLLDRERRGVLFPEERRRLDAHAVHCTACALERSVVFEFAGERRISREDDDAVSRLILGTVTVAAETQTMRHTSGFRTRPRTGGALWGILAGVAAAAIGAAGGSAVVVGMLSAHATKGSVVEAPLLDRRPSEPAALETMAAPPLAAAPSRGDVPSDALPASPSASDVAGAAKSRDLGPSMARPRPQVGERARRVVAAPPVELTAEGASASELFARANEARRHGDTAEAIRLYRLLREGFSGSREEITSRVALGRLLIDRMDQPSQALAMFDRYLVESPDGTLAEEARLGRALALMRLGRSAEERQAWQQLLAAHPRSVQAERARKRLEELR
jgi:Tetratricopeptide repeat